jgi:hypothetical protein
MAAAGAVHGDGRLGEISATAFATEKCFSEVLAGQPSRIVVEM